MAGHQSVPDKRYLCQCRVANQIKYNYNRDMHTFIHPANPVMRVQSHRDLPHFIKLRIT